VLLLRQVALLSIRASTVTTVDMNADGPVIGDIVPPDVAQAVGDAGVVMVVSASCKPCRDIVNALGSVDGRGNRLIVLLTGKPDAADDLAALMPETTHVVRDPEAGRLARLLSISSTPFAVAIRNGSVTEKAFVRQIDDLAGLVEQVGARVGQAHSRNGR
jgi:hypothetical protein